LRLSESLNSALNEQINAEFHNEMIYRQIQSYFEDFQLNGLASYFEKQANEENSHAKRFINYINSRSGGKVTCDQIDAPNLSLTDFNSVADVYAKAEENTSLSIEELYDLAFSEKSYLDLPFIEDFLREQVEEENKSQEFLMKIKLVKDIVLFDATFGG
jgi:ferritin